VSSKPRLKSDRVAVVALNKHGCTRAALRVRLDSREVQVIHRGNVLPVTLDDPALMQAVTPELADDLSTSVDVLLAGLDLFRRTPHLVQQQRESSSRINTATQLRQRASATM
jgi:hypothetical protein